VAEYVKTPALHPRTAGEMAAVQAAPDDASLSD